MAIISIVNSNRMLSKRIVNCFDRELLRYNVIRSLSFRSIIPNHDPKIISLQAKTFIMNSTTPILTSSRKGNSRIPSNLNLNLKVQQFVGVTMGARSFPLVLTNPIVCKFLLLSLSFSFWWTCSCSFCSVDK